MPRLKFAPARLICHSAEPEDPISRHIETLEGMLEEEFIARPLEVNLRGVINGYRMKGHALQQLEREEIHAYGDGQFLGAAKKEACKVYDLAREEGRVTADGSTWLEDVSFFPCLTIQAPKVLTRQPLSDEVQAYLSRVYDAVGGG